ncbi:hypothetical protein MJH12_07900 [bacterium]|nr:hypothetical protein [bacterium]
MSVKEVSLNSRTDILEAMKNNFRTEQGDKYVAIWLSQTRLLAIPIDHYVGLVTPLH